MRVLALLSVLLLVVASSAALTNVKVSRTLDLTTQLARETTTVELKNGASAETADSFDVTIPKAQADQFSFLSVIGDDGELELGIPEKADDGSLVITVKLAKPLAGGETTTLTLKTVYTHTMQPLPPTAPQVSEQKMVFEGNLFFYSPYKTKEQTITVKLASSSIESRTYYDPDNQQGSEIVYGPYKGIAASSVEPLRIHFVNNSPFYTVTEHERLIQVSHWGNVAFEERYSLEHSGPELEGGFSRHIFQRNREGSPAAIESFTQFFPSGAEEIFYRDQIGNISTSNYRVDEEADRGVFEFKPRYVLFGGWKSQFLFMYNVPSAAFLSNYGSRFLLNTTFGAGFDNRVVDEAIVKIILPEGASDIIVKTPFPVTRLTDEKFHSYGDTSGRPVVVLTASNLVNEHEQYFQVYYTFSSTSVLHEAFLLVAAFAAIFATLILLFRLDCTIVKSSAQSEAEREEEAMHILHAISLLEQSRNAAFEALEAAVSSARNRGGDAGVDAAQARFDKAFDGAQAKLEAAVEALGPANGAAQRDVIRLGELQQQRKGLHKSLNRALLGGKGKEAIQAADAPYKAATIEVETLLKQLTK